MKKRVALLLSLSVLLALVSCGRETNPVTSETSEVSNVSSETSSEELPADRLTEKEIQTLLAEYAKTLTRQAMKTKENIHIDMGGVKVDTEMESEVYADLTEGVEEFYTRAVTTDESGEQARISYFKDDRLYTITETTMGGMKMTEGYYEEKSLEETEAFVEMELTDVMLRKASVVRDENGRSITMQGDELKGLADELIAGQLGDLVDQGAAVNVEEFIWTLHVNNDGIFTNTEEHLTCKITVEQDGVVVEMEMSVETTGEILAYGEGSDIEIPEPKHLKTYPSFAEYMENQYGEGWEEWYYEDETGEV